MVEKTVKHKCHFSLRIEGIYDVDTLTYQLVAPPYLPANNMITSGSDSFLLLPAHGTNILEFYSPRRIFPTRSCYLYADCLFDA